MASAKLKSDPLIHTGDATVNGAASARPLRLTPAWAGREVALVDFEHATGQEGWRYELIDGRIEVSPSPNMPHDAILAWINRLFIYYKDAHPEVVNYVSNHSRVFVLGRRAATCPEPDFAAYHNYPYHLPARQRKWRDVSPFLVMETLSEKSTKDLVRNVELYLQVPSIREYWIFDPREDTDDPSLRVYRKRGRSWQKPIDVPFRATYTTRLLPGFSLLIDPDA
jgi:Uma2 family endonuclease